MLAFNMETKEIVFLKDCWRADVDGMEKEGEICALLESKGVPNIALFGNGKGDHVRRHVTLTHAQKREVGMVVEGYGTPRLILDVSGRRRSTFDFVQVLTGVREYNCRCHDG
jgi:hypothetical protein